jgi:hypothetical protein
VTYVIDAFKDYGSGTGAATTLSLQKFGTINYIKEARIVLDSSNARFALEGLFIARAQGHTASVNVQRLLGTHNDWTFNSGTLVPSTLTVDPASDNWLARSTFPVSNGGSTLERLHINDNRAGRYWSLTDNSSTTQYQLQVNDDTDTIMQFDGTLNKVSIGTTTVPTAADGTLRIAGATMSNLLDVYQTPEPAFRYRVRALGTQLGQNLENDRLGISANAMPVYSTGLFYNQKEGAAIKFWRGATDWDSSITFNTLGDSTSTLLGLSVATASERVIIKPYGEVMINAGQFFTASQIWNSGLGASASLNVFPITTGVTRPYALALYVNNTQWPILTKNTSVANQPDQFFVRHSSTDVHMGNARTGGLLIMTQSNVGVSTNLIVGTHTTPGARLDVRANAPYGAFRMQDTSEGAGKILMSDAQGDATWVAASSIIANGVTGSGTANFFPYWTSASNLSATSSILRNGDNIGVSGSVTAYNFLYNRPYASTAMRYTKSVPGLTSSAFINLFRVDGDTLASGVRASFTGTVGSSVTNVVVDILVSHFQDIYVESISGNYTELTLRIISDNDQNFVVQGKMFALNSPTYNDLRVEVFPYSSEVITFDGITVPSGTSTSTTYEHACGINGKVISGTGSGSDDLASLSLSGRLAVGQVAASVYPQAKLHVNNTSNSLSVLIEDSQYGDSTPFMISDDGNVHIGTNTVNTSTKLNVVATSAFGGFRLQDTSQGPNKVLVSDADGDASWLTYSNVFSAVSGVTGSGQPLRFTYWNTASNLATSSDLFYDPTERKIGMGQTPVVNTRLQLGWTMSDVNNTEAYGAFLKSNVVVAASLMSGIKQGIKVETETTGTTGTANEIHGALIVNRNLNSTKTNNMYGVTSRAEIGLNAKADTIYAFSARNYLSDTQTSAKGTARRQYGLHVQELTGATGGNWAIFSQGLNTQSLLQGRLGLGYEEPLAKLHIAGDNSTFNRYGAILIHDLTSTSPTFSSIIFAASDFSERHYIYTSNNSNDKEDYMKIGSRFGNIQFTTGNMRLQQPSSVAGALFSGPTTRMIIENGGNVGIGLTGPTSKLHVRSSAANSTVIEADGVSGELFGVTDTLNGVLFTVNDVSGLPVLRASSDNTVTLGDFQAPVLMTTVKTTKGANLTNSFVYSLSATQYNTAFFEYNVLSGTNSRVGTITAVWNSISLEFNETSTIDIGNTLGTGAITFNVALSGANVLLRSTTAAGGGTWTIKVFVRAF